VGDLHTILGIAVLATNAVVAVWGAVSWIRRDPSVEFWYVLRVAQAVVAVQVVLGLFLLASGERAPDELHVVYGVAPLVVTLFTEGMRVGAAQRELEEVEDPESLPHAEQVALARRVVLREIGVMTVGAILIVTLALRAASSGGLF
jgi:hypothetical protein